MTTKMTWAAVLMAMAMAFPASAQRSQASAADDDNEINEAEGGGRRAMSSLEVVKIPLDEDGEREIRISYNNRLSTLGPDYPRIETVKPGAVIEITESAAPKLLTPIDLTFGETVIKKGNVSETYPGVYGLWLKKTDDGWSLVFNQKADVWGTMYDASADAAAIPLEYAFREEQVQDIAKQLLEVESEKDPKAAMSKRSKAPRMKITLEKTDNNGVLRIEWGAHAWTTTFTIG